MSNRRVVVLFAGNAGHGKSLSGEILGAKLQKLGLYVRVIAFADPIKLAAEHLLGIPKSVSYGSQEDKTSFTVYGRSARSWLQWIGTELGREMIDSDIWVHRFAERAIESNVDVVIGVDCRFNNEIHGLRQLLNSKMEMLVVRIVNPRVPVNLTHKSESEVYEMPNSTFDIVISNDGSIDELMSKISNLADHIYGVVGTPSNT